MEKNNGFLSRLYWAVADEQAVFADGLNLGELYERSEETKTAESIFARALGELELGEKEDTLINLYYRGCTENEKQGFINGFKLGMMLTRETDMGPLPD